MPLAVDHPVCNAINVHHDGFVGMASGLASAPKLLCSIAAPFANQGLTAQLIESGGAADSAAVHSLPLFFPH